MDIVYMNDCDSWRPMEGFKKGGDIVYVCICKQGR